MSRPGTVLHQMGLLTALSVVGGLLLAALALPVVGGLGWVANTSNSHLGDIPAALIDPPLAQHSVLRASDGSIIAVLAGAEDRVVVPLTSIPAVMQLSIVAIEDNRFYEHRGVDVRSLLRAAKQDSGSGTLSQGASTITQQYVKQALLEQATNSSASPAEKAAAQKAATEKTIGRKLLDARYAIALEKKLTKGEILQRYLNIAYFGQGVYGVGTAAEHYFGIPVQKLSLPQAALLAGLVNSPSAFDPTAYPKAAKARRDLVLEAVAKYQFLPQATVDKALATPLVVHVTKKNADSCATATAPYFCSYVRGKLLNDKALGATADQRQQAVFDGGLDITTTLSPKTQTAVDQGIRANVAVGIRQAMSVASIEPGTGRLLAIGQNRDYGAKPGQSKIVLADQHKWDVGSTFKAVTLMAALAQGVPLDTSFYSPSCLKGFGYTGTTGRCPGGVTNAGDSESGTFNLVTGTWESVNTYYIQLESQVGILNVRDMAKKLGDRSPGIDDNSRIGPSLTLGSANGASAIDMATMYATIAAHGKECDPRVIDKITNAAGKPVAFTQSAACSQVVDSSVADTATSILQGVLNQPKATAVGQGLGGRPSAGKTGTLDNQNGAWFVGFVPQIATAIGIFDPANPNLAIIPITSQRTGQTYSAHIFGGDIPAQTWHSIMTQAVEGLPVVDFAQPQTLGDGGSSGGGGGGSGGSSGGGGNNGGGSTTPSTPATTTPSTPATTTPGPQPSVKPTKKAPGKPTKKVPVPPPA